MTTSARYPLIVATDRPPLSQQDASSIGLARAQASLIRTVTERGGAWVAAGTAETKASAWLKPLYPAGDVLLAHRDNYCANTLASVYFGHDGSAPPQDSVWAAAHFAVSRHYARHIADPAAHGALVWIHDYPLQLVPGMLRELRPDLRIGYSLHSPFPSADALLTVAEHEQILTSLLAADLCSFPDVRSTANFTACAHTAGDVPPPLSALMPMPVDTHLIAQLATEGSVKANMVTMREQALSNNVGGWAVAVLGSIARSSSRQPTPAHGPAQLVRAPA